MAKTFFLTGSSRGLGRSIATAVLQAGHQLVATARKPAQLNDLVQRYGEQILPVALDVTDFANVKAAIDAGIQRFGHLDVVINNAGFASIGSVEDMSMPDMASQFNTNFFGSVHVIKAALPHLRERGAGRIIQISSIGARIATPGAAAYYATKWAISGFIESLATEVATLGIKVSALEPGGMKTDFAEDASLTIVPSGAAYDATAGATARMMKAPNYLESYADPAGIAAVVMRVAGLDEPPLRLVLGRGMLDYAKSFEQARADADELWKGMASTADGIAC